MKKVQSKRMPESALRWEAKALFSGCTPFPIPERKKARTYPKLYPRIWNPPGEYEEMALLQKPYVDRLLSRSLEEADPRAVDLLLRMAWGCVAALDTLARERPELLQPLARKLIMWPAFIGKKSALSGERKKRKDGKRSLNEWLIDTIELGADSPHKGNWNPYSPATQAAIGMHKWLGENRETLKLPELTQKTVDCWFELGWKALLAATNWHPEKHEYLREIGRHYASHSKNTGAQKEVTPATRETNIRGGIRKQVRQSFMGYLGGLKSD